MRTKLAVVVCLSFASSVWATQTICPADYHPFALGNEWEYEDEFIGNRTERILGIERGTGLFMLENPSPLEQGAVYYWSSDSLGMRLHKEFMPGLDMWVFCDPPITKFPPAMEAEAQHTSECTVINPMLPSFGTLTFSATFQGFEDHVVGETTYLLCAKVTTLEDGKGVDMQSRPTSVVIETTEWWAPGIGAVEKQFHIVRDYYNFMGMPQHDDFSFASRLLYFLPVPLLNLSSDITGEVHISWEGFPGLTYIVHYADSMTAAWEELPDKLVGTGDRMEWIDDGTQTGSHPGLPAVLKRFYRVGVQP